VAQLSCRAVGTASPPATVAPGVPVARTMAALHAGVVTRPEQGPPDGVGDTDTPRAPEIQAWITAEVARCKTAGLKGPPANLRLCRDGPPNVSMEDKVACTGACMDVMFPRAAIDHGDPRRTPDEQAVYQEGLDACIAQVDQSLGRGEIRCYFSGPIRGGATPPNPYTQCEEACRAHAARVRAQWAPR
jgi:hypothetical protein